MGAIGLERQRPDPFGSRRLEWRIEMRKKCSAARDFELQRRPELFRLDGDKHQIVLAGEMLGGGFHHLGCGREMDEAVGEVDGGASEGA